MADEVDITKTDEDRSQDEESFDWEEEIKSGSSWPSSVKDKTSSPDAKVRRSERIHGDKVVELRTDEVRWFYRTDDAKQPKAFNGRDSILIEIKWRLLNKIAVDGQTSEAAVFACHKDVVVLGRLYVVDINEKIIKPIYWTGKSYKLLRGTWFIQNSWEPLESETMVKSIEDEHLRVFRNQKIPRQPVFFDKETTKKPVLCVLKLKDCEIKWNSIVDVTLTYTSTKSRLMRYIPFTKKGVELCRGYSSNALLTDCPKSINHLVFVIPGIGQKRQVRSIIDKTDDFRELSDWLLDKYFPDCEGRPFFLPVEWRSSLKLDGDLVDSITLPFVESLRSTINATFMDIMYYTSPTYRSEVVDGLINAMNKLYRQFISHNSDFLGRNGLVSIVAHSLGSVIAYDILTSYSPLQMYDDFVTTRIEQHLTDVMGEEKRDLLKQLHEARLRLHNLEGGFLKMLQRDIPRLDFSTEYLFALGSPLGVFLALRQQKPHNVTPEQQQQHFKRLFNIFHPTDPVSYRIEPLVHRNYRSIRPLSIHSTHNAPKKKPYDSMEPELGHRRTIELSPDMSRERSPTAERVPSDLDLRVNGKIPIDIDTVSMSSTAESNASSPEFGRKNKEPQSPDKTGGGGWFSRFRSKPSVDGQKEPVSPVDSTACASEDMVRTAKQLVDRIPEEFRLKHRLDFMVKQGRTEVSYWSTWRSHFSYWNRDDVIMFVLCTLFPPKSCP